MHTNNLTRMFRKSKFLVLSIPQSKVFNVNKMIRTHWCSSPLLKLSPALTEAIVYFLLSDVS